MYFAITKLELWQLRRALDSGEDTAEAVALIEGILNGTEYHPEPVDISDEDREITEFAMQEGC